MAALVFTGIGAVAALVGFALLVAWVRHYPPVGAALIALIIIPLWETTGGRPLPPIVTLSGMSLYLPDVIALLLFVVGILEIEQLRVNLRGWLFPWVLFGVLLAMALLRGVLTYEPARAVNEGRPLLYFFWAMTWALAVRPDRLRLQTVSLVLGWILVLVAFYHGATHGFGGATSRVVTVDGYIQSGRVLVGSQAMALLLCAATVSLGQSGSEKVRAQFYAVSALVFGGVVVIAQHRSVWGAAALGIVAVLIGSGQKRARRQVFVQSLVGVLAVFVAWYSGIIGGSLADSASNRSTYEWRTAGWQVLISQAIARGPETVIFGNPFGSGASERKISRGGEVISSAAHNWYVTILLYLGIIGLAAIVAMLISALVKSRAKPPAWTFVLAAVAAYSWAYSADWYLAPWLGAAMVLSLGAGRIAKDPVMKSGREANPNRAPVNAVTRPVVSATY